MRRKLATAAALLYSALHLALTGVRQPLANFTGDFLASFPAWKTAALFGRMDFYTGSLSRYWGPPPIWHYGPVQHLITIPLFAFASLRQAYLVWLCINYLFVIITAILAMRSIDDGPLKATTVVVVLVVFCNFNPLFDAITQRCIELFELMLLFAAFLFYRRGRESACGIAVGVAAMAKFLPFIYLPWLVLKRRWRALRAALAVIVPIAIATQLVLGWQHSGIFIQLREGSFLDVELNQSISGMVARLIRWSHLGLPLAATSRVLIVLCLTALSALMLRLRRREDTADLEFGLLATAMILLLPHNQNYYLTFLLLPYLLLYARYRAGWRSWRAALLAVSFLLVAAPVPFSLLGATAFRLYLRAGIPFVGAALLVVVLVAELGMSCALSDPQPSCRSKKPLRTSPPF